MTPLFLFTAVLLALSGLLKVRTAQRASMGLPVLALLEVAAAFVVAGWALSNPPTRELGLRVILACIGLIVGSSLLMTMRVRARRKERDASEGARLVTYVKYLSAERKPGPEAKPERGPDRDGD